MRTNISLLAILFCLIGHSVLAQPSQSVVNVPTRTGVANRILLLARSAPKATLILMAGGHGGLQIFANGSVKWGEGNFLIRSNHLFVDQGVATIVVDAPSDRQTAPFLGGFRQTNEHAADLKAIIAWARENLGVPVWVVGTSRGTQSTAWIATQLQGADGPDGIVLTSSILSDPKGRPVPDMQLGKIEIPVLVVHHERDACAHCAFSDVVKLTSKLANSPRTQLITFTEGVASGDPCDAFHYHGYNGIEADVVHRIVAWITTAGP